MLKDRLKNYNVILASASPRRQAFLRELGLDYRVVLKPVEELYPNHLKGSEIADYLSKLKASPFLESLKQNDLVITSDTIVWINQRALGKPKDFEEAKDMLNTLSGNTHEVITSITLSSVKTQCTVNETTRVTFKQLTAAEIEYYILNFKPFDKAGAYGIQEWIGAIGITKIEGSYNNVVGLPTHVLYKTLNTFAS